MKQAGLYAVAGGLVGGVVLGVGTYVFGAIPLVIQWGDLTLDLGAGGLLTALLIVPFALSGALAGGFSAYIVVFGSRELSRFSGSWKNAFEQYRRPIVWATLTGTLAAVLLAWELPLTPGLYPHLVDQKASTGRPSVDSAQEPWRAIEAVQLAALIPRADDLVGRFQLFVTRGFFAGLPWIHAVALLILGGTLGCWSALVFAVYQVSRRAGGEAIFWSIWLLAGGFFLGIVTIGGFGYAFGGLGPRSSLEMYIYSFLNTGIPAAWIALAGVAGNTIFGLVGLAVRWRSTCAGLLAAANTGAILLLGTTTRVTLFLKPPVDSGRAFGWELPTPAWHILTYFEGHLVAPVLGLAPSAPLATLGVVIGVGLAFGGAFYGFNVSVADNRSLATGSFSRSQGRSPSSIAS